MSTSPVRFSGLSLPVSDVARSIAFYKQLGFEVQITNEKLSFALLRLGAGTLGLLEVKSVAGDGDDLPKRLRALVQIELETDDLDALYASFVATGIAVAVPPRDRGFEYSMQCRDPDGFTVEFAQGERGNNATKPA